MKNTAEFTRDLIFLLEALPVFPDRISRAGSCSTMKRALAIGDDHA